MSTETVFPVAETFYSIQGEGFWTGTPMFFIRLAGCNVGRYNKLLDGTLLPNTETPFQILHPEYATCTSYAGETFICDTDYRVKERLTISELVSRFPDLEDGVKHVVLTGGEPFIHKQLTELVHQLVLMSITVHIETSGTLPIPLFGDDELWTWITCAPKWGYDMTNTHRVNEWKFLVRDSEDEAAMRAFLYLHEVQDHIYVQPIDEMDPEVANTLIHREFAIDCVKRNPTWQLSAQLHKYLGVR